MYCCSLLEAQGREMLSSFMSRSCFPLDINRFLMSWKSVPVISVALTSMYNWMWHCRVVDFTFCSRPHALQVMTVDFSGVTYLHWQYAWYAVNKWTPSISASVVVFVIDLGSSNSLWTVYSPQLCTQFWVLLRLYLGFCILLLLNDYQMDRFSLLPNHKLDPIRLPLLCQKGHQGRRWQGIFLHHQFWLYSCHLFVVVWLLLQSSDTY